MYARSDRTMPFGRCRLFRRVAHVVCTVCRGYRSWSSGSRVFDSLHRPAHARVTLRRALARGHRCTRCTWRLQCTVRATRRRDAGDRLVARPADREPRTTRLRGVPRRRLAADRRREVHELPLRARSARRSERGPAREAERARPCVHRVSSRSSRSIVRRAVVVLRRVRSLRSRAHGMDARQGTSHRVCEVPSECDGVRTELRGCEDRVRVVSRATARGHTVRDARVRDVSPSRSLSGHRVRSRREGAPDRHLASQGRVRELSHGAARRDVTAAGVRELPCLARSTRRTLLGVRVRVVPRTIDRVHAGTTTIGVEAESVRSRSGDRLGANAVAHGPDLPVVSLGAGDRAVRPAPRGQGLPRLPRAPKRPRSEVSEPPVSQLPFPIAADQS